MVNQSAIPVWSSVTNQITLPQSDVLGVGGEGAVYSVASHPDLVAKIYHSNRRTSTVIDKLEVMINYPPRTEDDQTGHLFVAWPQHLVYDSASDVIGFLMPKVEKTHSLFEYYNPTLRRRHAPQIHYANLCTVAKSIAIALDRLHGSGYVVGDINESNAYITDNEHVTLIDSDSFQITDYQTAPPTIYRSMVGKPEYTPPELQGVSFAQVDRNIHHDRFALAVVIYQLLMEGTHPFRGRFTGAGEPPKVETCISNGFFLHSASRSVPIIPMPAAVEWDSLHEDIRALFRKCFDEGHTDPQARPAPRDWVDALDASMGTMKQCSNNHSHWYFDKQASGNTACPWCERINSVGIESFPENPGAQTFFPASQSQPTQPPPPSQLPQQQPPQIFPQQQPQFPQQPPPQTGPQPVPQSSAPPPIMQSSAATIPVWVMLVGMGYLGVRMYFLSDYSSIGLYSAYIPYFLAIAGLLFVTVFWRSHINTLLYRRLPFWLTSRGAVAVAFVWGVPGNRRDLWIRVLVASVTWFVLLLPVVILSAVMQEGGRAVDAAVVSLLPEPTPVPTRVPEPTQTPVPTSTPVLAPIASSPADIPVFNLVPSDFSTLDMLTLRKMFDAKDLPEGYLHEATTPFRGCLSDIGVSIDEMDILAHPHVPGGTLTIVSGEFSHGGVSDRLDALGFSMLKYQGSDLWTGSQACVDDAEYRHNVDAVAVLEGGYIIIGDEVPVKGIIETVKEGGRELRLNASATRAMDEAGQVLRVWTGYGDCGNCLNWALIWFPSAENNAVDLKYVIVYANAQTAREGRGAMEARISENFNLTRLDVNQDGEYLIFDMTVSYDASVP